MYISNSEPVQKTNMERIKLVLEYDGTNYSGWQIQSGQHTVQEELEQALNIYIRKPVRIIAAGRTDAGVHARNQVIHCDLPEGTDLRKLVHGLNGITNQDVVIKSAEQVRGDFHSRFDAKSRRYRYYISTRRTAIHRNYVWTVTHPLNKTIMQAGARIISAYENFQSFCKIKSEVAHYNCTIYDSHFLQENGLLIYEIKANRFLHGMVRAITGTLVQLGMGKLTLKEVHHLIAARDRRLVPATAPAKGLILEEVTY
jgi:tRNA pseudouridine38-40 synthase